MDGTSGEAGTHPSDREHSVVCSDLLSSLVSSTTVGNEDDDASEQRNASHRKNEDLWPLFGVLSPRRHSAVLGEISGRIEDCEHGGKHGKDDERATEVDASKGELGHTDSSLNSL